MEGNLALEQFKESHVEKELRVKLVQMTPEEDRCPGLRMGEDEPYCGQGQSRMSCNSLCLGMYCLDRRGQQSCMYKALGTPEAFNIPDYLTRN